MKFESGLILAAVSCIARPRASSARPTRGGSVRISATVGLVAVATEPRSSTVTVSNRGRRGDRDRRFVRPAR